MKAIELYNYGPADRAFRIVEKEIPEPAENEVLIRVKYSGINFADVVARRGLYPDAPKNPAVLGYDVMGTVEKTGNQITHLKPGDKVTALTRFGGYAEYVCAPGSGVAVLPEGMNEAESTAYATQACTAYYCAEYKTSLREGDNVLVHAAAGGVGSILVQLAKNRGCTVFGTASPSKLAYLEELGVDYPIDYRHKDFSDEIIKTVGDKNIDVAFDSIGGKVFKQSFKLLRPCGDMVSYGAAAQIDGSNKLKAIWAAIGFGLFSPIQLLLSSRSIIAVNMLRVADHKPELFNEILVNVLSMAEKAQIQARLAKLFDAENIAEAHQYIESRQSVGKVVIQW